MMGHEHILRDRRGDGSTHAPPVLGHKRDESTAGQDWQRGDLLFLYSNRAMGWIQESHDRIDQLKLTIALNTRYPNNLTGVNRKRDLVQTFNPG